jgi:hypothetical protein
MQKEELPEDELARYQEQQKLAEVKRITIKAQQRHTLTTEEYQVIKEYKQEEIERLREKHRLEGLSQEERYLLEKMKESVEKESQFYEQMVRSDASSSQSPSAVPCGRALAASPGGVVLGCHGGARTGRHVTEVECRVVFRLDSDAWVDGWRVAG